jgi:hypothetical protein
MFSKNSKLKTAKWRRYCPALKCRQDFTRRNYEEMCERRRYGKEEKTFVAAGRPVDGWWWKMEVISCFMLLIWQCFEPVHLKLLVFVIQDLKWW